MAATRPPHGEGSAWARGFDSLTLLQSVVPKPVSALVAGAERRRFGRGCARTLILRPRNETGNRSPDGLCSPELGTWPVQSTRSIPLFLQQAARPFVAAGSQLDRLPVGTTGAKPAADPRACAAHGIGRPARTAKPVRQAFTGRGRRALAHPAFRAYVHAGACKGAGGRAMAAEGQEARRWRLAAMPAATGSPWPVAESEWPVAESERTPVPRRSGL